MDAESFQVSQFAEVKGQLGESVEGDVQESEDLLLAQGLRQLAHLVVGDVEALQGFHVAQIGRDLLDSVTCQIQIHQ